ncbi:MAG: GntR family transcriptional regulator [Clostridia bacterium]
MGEMTFTSKSEYVYKYLRDNIKSSRFETGKLYKIVDIAAELGVSRTPVTEAIKLLVSQGYVILHPCVGFEVTGISQEQMQEVFKIRAALESLAIKEAILGCSEDDIGALEDILELCRKSVLEKNANEYSKNTEKFHFMLYGMAKMSRLSVILQDLWLHEGWYLQALKCDSDEVKNLLFDHYEIIEVLKKRDYSAVEKLVEDHTRKCMEVLSQEVARA